MEIFIQFYCKYLSDNSSINYGIFCNYMYGRIRHALNNVCSLNAAEVTLICLKHFCTADAQLYANV
jgi:hypothetical protein